MQSEKRGGCRFDAATTLEMVRRFQVEVGGGHAVSSVWITGFVGMYLPLVERLLLRRDAILAKAVDALGIGELLDDHMREVLSTIRIDWLRDIESLERELARRA